MSKNLEHGITVSISRRADEFFFMKIKIHGTLTHQDYEMMTQMLKNAIDGVPNPEVRVFMDATDFDGWDLRATWDDFVFGIEFRGIFTKMAFVGTETWERHGINVGNWFMNDEVKFFKSQEEAHLWLNQPHIEPNTPVEKDLSSRKDSIRNELESLFKSNLRVTDYNVPEADDQDASEILVSILQDKLNEIKKDVKAGKYRNY